MKQKTLNNKYEFEGKGLHTGKYSHMTIGPAGAGTGIRFVRTDIGAQAVVEALAENVTATTRSTTISKNGVSVVTIEHVMSALTGLGIDNALIEIDNEEVPILDGSARIYVEAMASDGLCEQNAERVYVEIDHEIEFVDEKSGAYVKITPADEPSFDIEVDFNSRVLGVQNAHWDLNVDYVKEIACCRTFVFFHEVEFLLANNLVKGGDVENAIVIVEHPVTDDQVARMADLFGQPHLGVSEQGYLTNLTLRFPDECGRHKMLDLIGDMRLAGGYMRAHVQAFKSGHRINTSAAKLVREAKN